MKLRELSQEVKKGEFLLAFFDLLLLILPGAGILFIFERQIFLSIDWVKLILLSGAITAPLSFINALILQPFFDDEVKQKEGGALFFSITAAVAITSILLYVSALCSYFLRAGSVRYFLKLMIGIEAIVMSISIYKDRQKNREKAKRSA